MFMSSGSVMKLKMQLCTFTCAQGLQTCGGGGGSKYPGSHTSAGSLSFKKLLIGGYEWVRIQHRLCTRRDKNDCMKVVIVYMGACNLKYAVGVLPYK